MPEFKLPEVFTINDNMIVPPIEEEKMDTVEILRGPNIKPFPTSQPMEDTIEAGVSLKVEDNITTDHIMPAGAKILPLRSNIPAISKFCFAVCDEKFHDRALEMKKSIIIGGANYGQGSSREHAALAPLYLGVKAVIVKSFARIHKANLINAGIIPLTFKNEADYDKISLKDELILNNIKELIKNDGKIVLLNKTTGDEIELIAELSERDREMLIDGGLLNFTKNRA